MTTKSLGLNESLYQYLLGVSLKETQLQQQLREETRTLDEYRMQIAPEQGQFMRFLIKALGVKTVIEVGTFTGYSALTMGMALPKNGKIICCDISETWTSIAMGYWKKAGIEDKIILEIAPATETLNRYHKAGFKADFIFIDADKENYKNYYELSLGLLSENGVILVDNTLWDGRVIDYSDQDSSTQAIRAFNQALHVDERVEIVMLPVADGLTLIRRA